MHILKKKNGPVEGFRLTNIRNEANMASPIYFERYIVSTSVLAKNIRTWESMCQYLFIFQSVYVDHTANSLEQH